MLGEVELLSAPGFAASDGRRRTARLGRRWWWIAPTVEDSAAVMPHDTKGYEINNRSGLHSSPLPPTTYSNTRVKRLAPLSPSLTYMTLTTTKTTLGSGVRWNLILRWSFVDLSIAASRLPFVEGVSNKKNWWPVLSARLVREDWDRARERDSGDFWRIYWMIYSANLVAVMPAVPHASPAVYQMLMHGTA